MQPMVNLALRAARNSGQDLVRRLDRFDREQSSGHEAVKFISDTIFSLEKGIIYELQKSLPEHNFTGRESGEQINDEKQPHWYISVLEEVANFRAGIPTYSIAILCKVQGKAEHAAVINPVNGDEFTASRGRGAQLNSRRIRCGRALSLDDTIIGLGHATGNTESQLKQRQLHAHLISKNYDIRSIGSGLLTVLYVAADRFQSALICNLNDTSLAIGQLMASEAGCLTADISGAPILTSQSNLAVANPRLLKTLLAQTA